MGVVALLSLGNDAVGLLSCRHGPVVIIGWESLEGATGVIARVA